MVLLALKEFSLTAPGEKCYASPIIEGYTFRMAPWTPTQTPGKKPDEGKLHPRRGFSAIHLDEMRGTEAQTAATQRVNRQMGELHHFAPQALTLTRRPHFLAKVKKGEETP